MNTAVTLDSVAKRAGCSKQSVSHILSRNDVRYSSSTRERVIAIAKELGYVPQAQAQMLKTGKSKMIGLGGVNWDDPNLFKAVTEAGQITNRNDHLLVVSTSGKFEDSATMLIRQRVDYFIMLGGHFYWGDSGHMPAIKAIEKRIVVVAPKAGVRPGCCRYQIVWDDAYGAELAAEHLLSLGHNQIAVLAGDLVTERISGFVKKCVDENVYPLVFISCREGETEAQVQKRLPWYDRKRIVTGSGLSYGELTAMALRYNAKTTAVYARNDLIADAALNKTRELNISVPNELSIMGYSDEIGNSWLSTIRVPIKDAVNICLTDYFESMEKKTEPRADSFELPVELIIRGSTGPVQR